MSNLKKYGAKFSVIGYVLFLIPLTVLVTFSIMLYQWISKFNNYWLSAIIIISFILISTLCFSIIDIYRRRIMIDKPVKQILEATQKIAVGNFNVKLQPTHHYTKYDEYDAIMENINKMCNELSKSEILKTEFIANVSHELKTPLAIIQNYAKALNNEKLDKEIKDKYIHTLVKTSQKLSNLITNILKLNKLENQSIMPEKEQINISQLLEEKIVEFEEVFENKNININCEIEPSILKSDASLIEIIFNNLISNAIKFTNNGGIINISLKNEKENIIFKVKDNGCGISKEVGEHIFEKFYQGDISHSSEGNGLGLAIVKKVIDILGAEINIQSELGKGSEFIIKLKKEL